ncbi:MAG: M15 family metallopeptidase [Paenisporosarcina sp.]
MQSRKYHQINKHKNKWKAPIMIGLGLIILLVPIIWLAIHNWDVEESLAETGYVKKMSDATPEPVIPNPVKPPVKQQDSEESPPKTEPTKPVPVTPEKSVKEEPPVPIETHEGNSYDPNQKLPEKPSFIQGILVANKRYPLPATYAPGESKEAREAFNKMAAAANLDGFDLVAFSTYRSFERQETLYNQYVEKDGQEEADRYSARPGYSEHQSGLAFDIGEKNFQQYWASPTFGETPAGKWMATHAHEYGFILRYPIGKEEVTGYMHESWHFRYVGVGPATDMYTNKKTLEEYLEL